MEENQIIDVSKILIIPSDTEIPVHNNLILTKRPLCTNFPDNATILDRTEAIKIITDISEDLNKSEETCINNLPVHIEELLAIFDPLKVTECNSDLFKEGKYTTCDSLDELKKLLSELLIKFDTNPEHYIKEDYLYLISVLYKSLIHLYETSTGSVITTEWNDPLRDNWVPSEKLTKETIDELDNKVSQEISNVNLDIEEEATVRQQADLNLLNSKQDKLIAGPGISIVDNVISNTNLSAEWGNIAGNLEDQEDLQEALDEKANIDDIPTNVSELNNDAGYLTTETDPTVPSWAKQPSKPTYTASEVGALPDDTFIPEKTSDLTNDSGFITSADITGKEDKSNKVTSISSSSTNTQYPSAKCVYDEFTTTVTSEQASSVSDITVYTNLNIQVIDKTQDSSTTFAIDPNKMYMFGERTLLTITLNPGESGIVNEYMFLFTSGSVATTLNVPVSVTWSQTPNLQTNKKYLVDIENNLGLMGEWEDE